MPHVSCEFGRPKFQINLCLRGNQFETDIVDFPLQYFQIKEKVVSWVEFKMHYSVEDFVLIVLYS